MTRFYTKLESMYGKGFTNFLERGMKGLWPSLLSVEQWSCLFEETGFQIKSIESVIDNDFVPVWNVGMRPFSSQIINMYNHMKKGSIEDALKVKNEYKDIIRSFSNDFSVADEGGDSCGHLFVLKK